MVTTITIKYQIQYGLIVKIKVVFVYIDTKICGFVWLDFEYNEKMLLMIFEEIKKKILK